MDSRIKITYRSDTVAATYQMVQLVPEGFVIQTVQFGMVVRQSPFYPYIATWRGNINKFFDIVDAHINSNEWIEP